MKIGKNKFINGPTTELKNNTWDAKLSFPKALKMAIVMKIKPKLDSVNAEAAL